MFGKRLRVEIQTERTKKGVVLPKGWGITLRPGTKDEILSLAEPGSEPYFGYTTNQTNGYTSLNMEQWYEKLATRQNSYAWVIEVDAIKDASLDKTIVGVTNLSEYSPNENIWGTGSGISKKEYWGFGVISLAHMARTWFALNFLNTWQIVSTVQAGTAETMYEGNKEKWLETNSSLYGNWGSRLGLERVGYVLYGTHPAERPSKGSWHGTWQFVLNNPMYKPIMWPSGIPEKYEKGYQKTIEAMDNAKKMIVNI